MSSLVHLPTRVAIVHEWLTGMRGGEKCVEALCELFPDATLFTLLHVKGTVSAIIERMPIRSSFIQELPWATERYRNYLPLFPTAIQQFRLDEFDLVISSSHCVAKGVRTSPRTLHICYCYTPMRYIWNLYDEYFSKARAGLLTRFGMRLFVNYLRRWDLRTANNPYHYIAISENIRQRIEQLYKKPAEVIYPPVDTSMFQLSEKHGDYFLIVSAFVPYKRIDLAIEAFNRCGVRLVVIGDGPDDARLRRMAKPNIEFLGWQPNERLRQYYAECKAVVFPGEEDFGIVPVEAMASGKPVIAFAKGGALETVFDTPTIKTGILFPEATVDSLLDALERFEQTSFVPQSLRSFALTFDREVYKSRMKSSIEKKWIEFNAKSPQTSGLKQVISSLR